MKPKFALVGVGYVSPKHFRAIKENGGELLAICDTTHDVVGSIDAYFNDCLFFRDENKFRNYCKENKPDYLCVTTPNYNHFEQIKFGLESGCDVICEKPLVIKPEHLHELSTLEQTTGKKVWSILQLRLHKDLVRLKEVLEASDYNEYNGNLRYVTPRGPWYFSGCWKGIEEKSGSILYNLGIHLFDACCFLMGNCNKAELFSLSHNKAHGKLHLEKGNVEWFLSCDKDDVIEGLPKRCFEIDEYVLNLDQGFTDLHVSVYSNILQGIGYGIEDARSAIELIHNMKESYKTSKMEK
jgi:UDP-N-acetyl-2-amino-2-deoxyglucuronate dehydrogenase